MLKQSSQEKQINWVSYKELSNKLTNSEIIEISPFFQIVPGISMTQMGPVLIHLLNFCTVLWENNVDFLKSYFKSIPLAIYFVL